MAEGQFPFDDYVQDMEILLIQYKEAIKKILNDDTLKDLPKDVTAEEIKSELQLLHGQSMMLYLVQADGNKFNIVVPSSNTRVTALKKCIERQVNAQMKRSGVAKCISWKYVWKAYLLSFDGMKITNENALLSELGIESQSEITFAKRLKDKIRIK